MSQPIRLVQQAAQPIDFSCPLCASVHAAYIFGTSQFRIFRCGGCALTFSDAFSAGTSMYGIGDLETFARQTHKFESRYLDRLIGPYPERRDLYHDRSPLNFSERISCPVLILQGAEDRIVPPAQAEQIVDALWERHLPHAYVLFPGEDHGFRSAANIIRSFEAELSFYGQVFGFEPAGGIEPITIEFLERGVEAPAETGSRTRPGRAAPA